MSTRIDYQSDNLTDQHRLAPLLAPQSIALVGASLQMDVAGNDMILELLQSGYQGKIYPVNPKYAEVEGMLCFPSLSALPESVDLVVLAIGNQRLEAQLKEAIRVGAKAVVIFGSGHLEEDIDQPLLERIRQLANDSNIPVCGGNCMGFYNLDRQIRVFPQHIDRPFRSGGVTFISQSGSVLTSLLWNDQKLRFNLAVSTGQELVTTAEDYMDYALEQPSTRVIAIFLESARHPKRFIEALQKANEKNIPVVILKAGRTEVAATLAMSHSGAIAGNNVAYQAIFARYGVIAVKSIAELAATALLLSMPQRPGSGGVAAIMDSGGEREILIDLADDIGVPFAKINAETTAVLVENLDEGLEPINPLDAWGTGNNYKAIYEYCWQALMSDPDAAIGVFVADLTSGFWLHESFARICRRVSARINKPIIMMTNHQGSGNQDLAMRLTQAGIPVFDGAEPTLAAIKHAFAYRDFQARTCMVPMLPVTEDVRESWRARLQKGDLLDEAKGLRLLSDYGIPTQQSIIADTLDTVLSAANELGYPVVLKTATQGILHKSDVGGVKLNLADEYALKEAYFDIAGRLGYRVLVTPMAQGSIEVALGVLSDPQFGPMVMVAGGGVFIEILKDSQVALAPIDLNEAHMMINKLAMRPILGGIRGAEPVDIDGLAQALARLSLLAEDLGDLIAELDVNPVKVDVNGCIAVDALVVPHGVKCAEQAA
ncbi:acetate--CoA ligase family protein [Neptunomonas sp.]|uniref:acetate--CoA ligase family protein n=1 Tax=Neptunomonas sp. TaxID=1971898 RepID=UPI00356680C8